MSFCQHTVTVTPSKIGPSSACTLAEKMCVVKRTHSLGFACCAALIEGLPQSMVQHWVSQEEQLKQRVKALIPSKKKNVSEEKGGRKSPFGDEVVGQLLVHCREHHG